MSLQTSFFEDVICVKFSSHIFLAKFDVNRQISCWLCLLLSRHKQLSCVK